jgi:hypothetical protein
MGMCSATCQAFILRALSEGTEVSNNHVHHIYAYDYGGWGLYTDEGSSNIFWKTTWCTTQNRVDFTNTMVKENIRSETTFLHSVKCIRLQATRVEDHLSFPLRKQYCDYTTKVYSFKGPGQRCNVEIDKNIYWNMSG